jgi:hypothetical protein
MLYRLVRTFILCSCLLGASAHAAVESTDMLEQNDTQTLSTDTEYLIAEIASLEAELDNFSALDDLDLPDVDTSLWMQMKMARDLLVAHIVEHKVAYLVATTALVGGITALCIYKKKQAATHT